MRCRCAICVLILVKALLDPFTADSATTNAASTLPSSTNAAAAQKAIPLTEIATQAESASGALDTIATDISTDKTTPIIQEKLPVLTDEIGTRLEENARVLARNHSLSLLRKLNSEWDEIRQELAGWKRDLARRTTQVDSDLGRLKDLEKLWTATREQNAASNMPPELLQKVDGIIQQTKETRQTAETQEQALLTLQARVSEQGTRVNQAISAIQHAREETLGQLLVRDSPTIWSLAFQPKTASNVAAQSRRSFSRQVRSLETYASRKTTQFLLHGIIFVGFLALVMAARRGLRSFKETDSTMKHAALVFETPIATALVLSLIVSSWIYPQAPRLLWAILGAAALIPAAIVLRRLISRPLFPVLNALVAFYFIDQLASVTAAPELLSRALFVAEMLAATLFVLWLIKRGNIIPPQKTWPRKMVRWGAWAAAVLLAAAFLANIFGYGGLSQLIGGATMTSAYLALILYAIVRIADGLIFSGLSIGPVARLEMIRRHRSYVHHRTLQVLEWSALVIWIIYTLEAFSLRAPLFQDLKQILTTRFEVGSINFPLGNVLLLVVTIWAAVIVSRILRFVLEEEVYPRVDLAPGLHYSISRMVHYAVLVAGFLIGIALVGFDLTRLTILAGAVGVGLGFGLQNIINNFVSGIILLFERPIKVGDVIQLDSTEGTVTRIGIRASTVQTINGPEIIVPNGKLISDPVTNYTFSRRQRLITIPLAVAPNADARRVMDILRQVASAQPSVRRDPGPQALLINFGGGALNFELRVWTDQIQDWLQIRSDLAAAISAALTEQNISIK